MAAASLSTLAQSGIKQDVLAQGPWWAHLSPDFNTDLYEALSLTAAAIALAWKAGGWPAALLLVGVAGLASPMAVTGNATFDLASGWEPRFGRLAFGGLTLLALGAGKWL
jgi:hypothetical protein